MLVAACASTIGPYDERGCHSMNKPDKPSAAIYVRVSTEDQGKGFSIPTQIEACQKLDDREGYVVAEGHVLKSFRLGAS
jgi:Resolvase, N terminal domain